MTEPKLDITGYRLLGAIGAGALSTVRRAERTKDGADVALKILRADISSASPLALPFLREARILRRLTHAHVIGFIEVGSAGGRMYMALERAPGGDLAARLRKRGPLAHTSAIRIVREICSALVYLHERDVVHRDLKPSNVLLTRAGEAKVADFGLAWDPQESEVPRVGFGTPAYMAPEERLAGDRGATSDARADLYSLGVTAFEMVTGRRPASRTDRLPAGSSRPRAFDELVNELRAAHPNDRPESAASVMKRLDALRD